jgi:cytochrome c2
MNPLLALMVIVTVGIATAVLTGTAQRAEANPATAQKTGKGCPTCHTAAPPALNNTGKKYKATGKL